MPAVFHMPLRSPSHAEESKLQLPSYDIDTTAILRTTRIHAQHNVQGRSKAHEAALPNAASPNNRLGVCCLVSARPDRRAPQRLHGLLDAQRVVAAWAAVHGILAPVAAGRGKEVHTHGC